MRKPNLALIVTLALVAFPGTASAAGGDSKPINEKRIWKQRWEKASEAERGWANSTSACETRGMSREQGARANTGNGYLGGFQFDPGTWWTSPNTGPGRGNAHQLPHLEPWRVQAVVAIKLMRRDGSGHWPNCG